MRIIAIAIVLASALSMTATLTRAGKPPGIILGNGVLVPGAIPRLEIEKRLNAAPVQAAQRP